MKPLLTLLFLSSCALVSAEKKKEVPISYFNALHAGNPSQFNKSLAQINAGWQDRYGPMVIESLRFAKDRRTYDALSAFLLDKTKLSKKSDLTDFWQWAWKNPYQPHSKYAEFKEKLYENIDSDFSEYFDNNPKSSIRLDEIRWGGVIRDGIPPLKDPKVVPASQASYLGNKDIVFGVSFNGVARAYPKRILAWHEMVKDKVGGKSINGVYCTLCGSMIVYDTNFKGKHYELGTSGFLYRSNKLMYDHKTKSMWSTIEGKPVVGPLVGKGIQLAPLTVVTTTWGEWKKRHPNTTVLSLDTGYVRDYGEGVAYKNYFATDKLMFDVPQGLEDKSLKNKDSILALRFGAEADDKVAFAPKFLKKNPVYNYRHKDIAVVILTDASGASRVYNTGGYPFKKWDKNFTVYGANNEKWTLTEKQLSDTTGKIFPRYPSHNAFWFGWHSAYPQTVLIK